MPQDSMEFPYYRAGWYFAAFIKQQCIREVVLHGDRLRRPGAFLVACTHLSHIEPMLISTQTRRHIRWMARQEFYHNVWLRPVMQLSGAFSVNRQGIPVSSVRKAIQLAQAGHVVGIFPEGGCRKGTDLAIRGGRIKQGVATIALRAQIPILPVVVLGTDKMTSVDAWLPGKYGRVWTNFGNWITPPALPARKQRRDARRALARQLEIEYIRAYDELLDQAQLTDGCIP
jgi:1-acyl-sn-glycerol-3-phosphate acyltransferase